MMPRRALVAAFVLPLALIACSSQDKEPAQATRSTPAPTPAPAPAPSKPAPAPSASTTTPAENPHTGNMPAGTVSRTGMRIRFGIMPGNYDDDQDGIVVADVFPGTSAGDAGIQKGDRLMTWNGKPITTVEDWMEHMSPHKPGDVVDVGVLRDGKTVPIKVTLKAAE